MFTGLVEEVGRLRARRPRGGSVELAIASTRVAATARPGDSIAIDGVCLTVERLEGDGFLCFASPETIARTTLGERAVGAALNLEASLTLDKRLGGHLVQGHVDGLATVAALEQTGESWTLAVDLPDALAAQCVEKGSIALDGISLTIARLDGRRIEVAIIPVTWRETNLHERRTGDTMNVETDIIGKYVARFLEAHVGATGGSGGSGGVTRDLLRRAGYLAHDDA